MTILDRIFWVTGLILWCLLGLLALTCIVGLIISVFPSRWKPKKPNLTVGCNGEVLKNEEKSEKSEENKP